MSTKQRIVSLLHHFFFQRLGHQNLFSSIFHFILSLTYQVPNSSTFFVRNPVSLSCLCFFRFFKFLQRRIFLESNQLLFIYSHFQLCFLQLQWFGISTFPSLCSDNRGGHYSSLWIRIIRIPGSRNIPNN